MATVIRKIAEFLVKNWNKLSPLVQKAIKAIAGSIIVDYITKGVEALITWLSQQGTWLIEQIAKLLGIS